jgi:hypothetical protein
MASVRVQEAATVVDLPAAVVLEISSLGLRVDAHVAWRRGKRHGVQFVWPQHTRFSPLR